MLRTRRELWIWCALPIAINVATFAAAIAAFLVWLWDPLSASLAGALALADPSAWYEWLWVGPLRALAWLLRWLLLAVLMLFVYFTFTLVGGVLASPFLDALSRRVEMARTGRIDEVGAATLAETVRSAARVFLEDGKRIAFFLTVQVALLALGLLIPPLQPVTAVAAFAFAVLFLPLEYTAYALDRRGVPFRERRRWIWARRGAMLGFGVFASATFLIPGLNFFSLPWLVTSGTLLALDLDTSSSGGDGPG
jgi:CysZ protein